MPCQLGSNGKPVGKIYPNKDLRPRLTSKQGNKQDLGFSSSQELYLPTQTSTCLTHSQRGSDRKTAQAGPARLSQTRIRLGASGLVGKSLARAGDLGKRPDNLAASNLLIVKSNSIKKLGSAKQESEEYTVVRKSRQKLKRVIKMENIGQTKSDETLQHTFEELFSDAKTNNFMR